MLFKPAIALVGLCTISFTMALPEPHKGMVDSANIRDIGVVYSKPNFQGYKGFILEHKGASNCQSIDVSVGSIQICKEDVQCTFYDGSDCNENPNNFAVAIGCGDAPYVDSPKGNHFNSYRCGKPGTLGPANYIVTTTPHDASQDETTDMGR